MQGFIDHNRQLGLHPKQIGIASAPLCPARGAPRSQHLSAGRSWAGNEGGSWVTSKLGSHLKTALGARVAVRRRDAMQRHTSDRSHKSRRVLFWLAPWSKNIFYYLPVSI